MSTVVAIGSVGLAQAIEREHEAAIGAARACLEHAIRCGELLIRAKAGVPHGQWRLWVEANLSFGPRQAQKYMRLAERGDQMRILNSHFTIDAALAALAEPQTEQGASHTLRVMTSSESSEWYTPPHIVDLVEATLGEIDLDPCWHPDSPVRATTTYTAADDGLARLWSGRLYLNPPYGRQIDEWIDKLVAEYDSGSVTEAIALVPARTDTAWFRRLDRFPICFVYGRLSFSGMEGGALFPSAIVYLGRNTRYFAKIFCHVGGIWVRFDGDVPGAPQPRWSATAGSTASLHRARGGPGSAPTGDVGLCSGKPSRFAEVHCGAMQSESAALPPEVEVVVLIANADPVGEQAAGRAKPVYLDQGVRAQVVVPPAGQDIDDLLRRAPAMVSAA